MKTRTCRILIGVGCLSLVSLSSRALAQEGSFADYKQPAPDFISYKGNFDTLSFGNAAVAAYGTTTGASATGYYGSGYSVSQWPVNGLFTNNGTAGFAISNPVNPEGRDTTVMDIRFMYKADTGAPKKFRVDLIGLLSSSTGTVANGGIITLSAAGSWLGAMTRRNQDLNLLGVPLPVTQIRIVAIQDGASQYPSFGTYNRSSAVVLDNLRVTIPRRLSGLSRISNGSNDVSAVLFANTGNQLKASVPYMQSLGSNSTLIDVFGSSDFAGLLYKNSTSIPFVANDLLGTPILNAARYTTSLQGSLGASVIGTMPSYSSNDRFYGYMANPANPVASFMLRENYSNGVYTQYARTSKNLLDSTPEVTLPLGNEKIMAVADINCDGADDFITRSGQNVKLRTFQGYANSDDSALTLLNAPVNMSTYGNLTCYAAADLNNDGFQDLILWDPSVGDVFSLICKPNGGTLKWLFRLGATEKMVALADADNDGSADIYGTRVKGPAVGEATIRKIAPDGLSVTNYDLVFQYDRVNYAPCAVGDINGDGSADIVFIANDAPDYSVFTCLVNPANRYILGMTPYWICSAYTPRVRPIYYHGLN